MKLKLVLFSSCALLFSSLSSSAQQEREERLWLTTPDRANEKHRKGQVSRYFSSDGGQLPVLTVDDVQRLPDNGRLWLCADGGSAQLH